MSLTAPVWAPRRCGSRRRRTVKWCWGAGAAAECLPPFRFLLAALLFCLLCFGASLWTLLRTLYLYSFPYIASLLQTAHWKTKKVTRTYKTLSLITARNDSCDVHNMYHFNIYSFQAIWKILVANMAYTDIIYWTIMIYYDIQIYMKTSSLCNKNSVSINPFSYS